MKYDSCSDLILKPFSLWKILGNPKGKKLLKWLKVRFFGKLAANKISKKNYEVFLNFNQ